jgi:ketosteroid isomerase-like protein
MHPNEQLIRRQVESFIAGNIAGWLETVSDDLVVHVAPGHPLSGDYRGGQQFVERFIGKVMEITGGVNLEVHDIVASDEHGVGLYTVRTQRGGKTYEWSHTNVYHCRDGKITEIWWTPFDQAKVAELLS